MSENGTLRSQSFTTDGPAELLVELGAGRVEVTLTDQDGVDVQVRHAPDGANPWAEGITGLISWVTEQIGDQRPTDLPEQAVREARIDYSGKRLTVRSARAAHLKAVPLTVTVRAPHGSRVTTRAGAAEVTVSGRADQVDIGTGAGDVRVEQATGAVRVTSGTGSVRLGPTPAGVQVRSGSGEIDLVEVGGPSTVASSSGDIRVGSVAGDLKVRSGTGDITVVEASAGELALTTGSGALRIGVKAGCAAEVDVSSGAGQARSELPLSGVRPAAAPLLKISGRTGSGSALVSLAS